MRDSECIQSLLFFQVVTGSKQNYVPSPQQNIGSFHIDETIGRDVKIQIDYGMAVTIDKVHKKHERSLLVHNVFIEGHV